MKEEIFCRVSGRVQGVLYRDFVARKARRLSLAGYVRNTPDFKVEVVAQGSRPELEKLIAYLRKGSLLSKVSDVAVEWREPKDPYDSFDIVF